MKESLSDIIKKHRNWYSVSYDLNIDDATKLTEIDIEMSDAANLYAESLHTGRWQIEVQNDIHDIFTHEPPGTRFNREMAERHTAIVDLLVGAVKRALINHAFDISQLDRVTQWRFGEVGRGTKIEDDLTRDEADRLLHSMSKQGFRAQRFRELCSDLYTVLAYKVEASQTVPTGTSSEAALGTPPKKERKKPGAKKTTFEQFIVCKSEIENVLTTITNNIEKDNPAQAALLIAGAIAAGKVSIKVTAASVSRKFGVLEPSIKPHFQKYRANQDTYYTEAEIKPYKDLFST